jgi:hypothetical protein
MNVAENRDMIERIVATEAREREAVIISVAQPSSRIIVHPTILPMPCLNFTNKQLKDMRKYWNNFNLLMRKSWSL